MSLPESNDGELRDGEGLPRAALAESPRRRKVQFVIDPADPNRPRREGPRRRVRRPEPVTRFEVVRYAFEQFFGGPLVAGLLAAATCGILFPVVIAAILRSLGLVPRWIALGPGNVVDRTLCGCAFLMVPIVVGSLPFGVPWCVPAVATYCLTHLAGWTVLRLLGERETLPGGPPESTYRLRDLMIGLALFGVAAGLLRGLTEALPSLTIELGEVVSVTLRIAIFAAFTFVADAGVRLAFHPGSIARRALGTAATIGVTMLGYIFVVLFEQPNDYIFAAILMVVFAACYVAYAGVQEWTFAQVGVRPRRLARQRLSAMNRTTVTPTRGGAS